MSTLADGSTARGLQRVSRAGIGDVDGSEGLLRGVHSGLGEVKCIFHDLVSVSVVSLLLGSRKHFLPANPRGQRSMLTLRYWT